MVPILLSIRKKRSFQLSCTERRYNLCVLLLTRSVSSQPQSSLHSTPPKSSNHSLGGPVKRAPIAPEVGLSHAPSCPHFPSTSSNRSPPRRVRASPEATAESCLWEGRGTELCKVTQICSYVGLHPREVVQDGTVLHAPPRPLRHTVSNTVGLNTLNSGQ